MHTYYITKTSDKVKTHFCPFHALALEVTQFFRHRKLCERKECGCVPELRWAWWERRNFMSVAYWNIVFRSKDNYLIYEPEDYVIIIMLLRLWIAVYALKNIIRRDKTLLCLSLLNDFALTYGRGNCYLPQTVRRRDPVPLAPTRRFQQLR